MNPLAPRHFALLVLVCAAWGFNLVAIHWGMAQSPPIFLSFLRFATLAVCLVPFLKPRAGDFGWLLLASVCSGGLQFALLFVGISLSGNLSSVAIAGQLGVPFTTLLSILLLGETVRWRRWAGIAMSVAGVGIMGFDPAVLDSPVGLWLVIGGAASGALGVVAVKKAGPVRPLELQAWFAWSSLPVLAALTWWFEDGQLQVLASADHVLLWSVLYSALVSSLFAHTVFFSLVQRYPVSQVMPITLLSPIFSIAFVVTFVGEALGWRIWVGGLLTLAGVLVIELRKRRLAEAGA
ncbi:MAG: DMT family transporter [Steroidobacteraceae bacterium]